MCLFQRRRKLLLVYLVYVGKTSIGLRVLIRTAMKTWKGNKSKKWLSVLCLMFRIRTLICIDMITRNFFVFYIIIYNLCLWVKICTFIFLIWLSIPSCFWYYYRYLHLFDIIMRIFIYLIWLSVPYSSSVHLCILLSVQFLMLYLLYIQHSDQAHFCQSNYCTSSSTPFP